MPENQEAAASTQEVAIVGPDPSAGMQLEAPDLTALSFHEAHWIGRVFATSGFFKDSRGEAQAITKIIAGQEIGLTPMQAMSGIHVFDGKVTLSSGLIGQLIKRSGHYRYKVVESSEERCEIEILEKAALLSGGEWESLGSASFTIEEAQRAGLLSKHNWKAYPGDMLFARAISRAARRFCPEVFGGAVYTEDELDEAPKDPLETRNDQLEQQGVELAQLAEAPPAEEAAPEKPKRKGRKAESAKIAEKVLAEQEQASEESAAEVPPTAADQEAGEEPTPPVQEPASEASALEPAASEAAAAPAEPEPASDNLFGAGEEEPDPPAESKPREVTEADQDRITQLVKDLISLIGPERTDKGYKGLRAKAGMIEGETFSTREQVETVAQGLEEAIQLFTAQKAGQA